jgi:hypothetical protein
MAQKQKDKVSKAAFVRARPTASVDEVIAAGKAEGVEISRSTVHNIRYQAKVDKELNVKVAAKKRKSAKKAKTNGHAKGNGHAINISRLAKHPGPRKTHEVLDPIDEKEIADRLALSLRLMVRHSVRDEVRALLGGVLNL